LRNDISRCGALFALITPESVSSGSVFFELGAAWILGKSLFFVCLGGLDFRDLPEPLGNFPSADAEEKDAPLRLTSLCREAATALGFGMKRGPNVVASLKELLVAVANRPKEEDFVQPDEEEMFENPTEERQDEFSVAEWRGSDRCEIIFAVGSVARQESAKVRLYWDDVFMTLAQNLRQAQDEKFVESVLLELCRGKDHDFSKALGYKIITDPKIKPECFALITSRLSSMGFIATSKPPHTVFQKQARGTFWKLTQGGEDHLRKIISDRRKLRM
jgi:hypothetical protein